MDRTILIIDDNEDDVLIAERTIAKLSREVKTLAVPNGEAGLALLRTMEALPAFILLDLKMPGMGGIEFLRAIRSDERFKGIAVAVLTHSDLKSDVADSQHAGANVVLRKTFSMEKFKAEIREIMERWLPQLVIPAP